MGGAKRYPSLRASALVATASSFCDLPVTERNHCGVDIKMKIEESEKVIKLRLWPTHICEALGKTKGVRAIIAKQLDEHCSENAIAQQKAAK